MFPHTQGNEHHVYNDNKYVWNIILDMQDALLLLIAAISPISKHKIQSVPIYNMLHLGQYE